LLKINSYESILLGTAFINLKNPFASQFSLQEIFQNDEYEDASKMIHLHCEKASINKDSTMEFRFIEKRDPNLEPLDPLNYDRSFGVSLTGALHSPSVNCILLWKDTAGRPFSARIRLLQLKR